MHPAIAVLTRKNAKDIIDKAGVETSVLNPENARRYKYLVCCRNGKYSDEDADEPHASAFLVALIDNFRALTTNARGQKRYRITFSKYARVLSPGAWKNWRNPVHYTSLEELGISVTNLKFSNEEGPFVPPSLSEPIRKLTIAEAKEGLAEMLGISPDAIEITIKA